MDTGRTGSPTVRGTFRTAVGAAIGTAVMNARRTRRATVRRTLRTAVGTAIGTAVMNARRTRRATVRRAFLLVRVLLGVGHGSSRASIELGQGDRSWAPR
ncbi:hypothetical protein [Streptomyces sp. ITFR-6]|uniref:hypothetical protein n=1 Tax=Streptomyces sp. ITFR-6 TaxID=3075197 RepID=UPI00288C4E37|nr:hypothetical protein [Streptomyces sp. ITFR-6]WNI28316.1 hypothetical protein RLT59_05640 [Streptomyces sp. ITFR-6]